MKILLGVTGGIAAYKSLELTRLFVKAGHEVQVVMTAGAEEFIRPLSFQALSGRPVRDSLFDLNQEAGMGHIDLARWADLIVIAPASAETLAKLRMGRADDLLTTLCLATEKPIMVVPAMNRVMWANQATRENLQVLQQRGLNVLQPASGEQACGEVGEGRMPEPEAIFSAVESRFDELDRQRQMRQANRRLWKGRKLLITAGPTYEDIDPVRFIGNRSSGKMGFAIAQAAVDAGAEVTLVAGPVALPTPPGVERVDVRSAEQMFQAVQRCYVDADCFVSAAAVADFRPVSTAEHKIKKHGGSDSMTIELTQNPDIVAWVAQQSDRPYVVGFAAETRELEAYAEDKRRRKKLDMICANRVGGGHGFETEDNALLVITEEGRDELPRSSKAALGQALLGRIGPRLPDPKTDSR